MYDPQVSNLAYECPRHNLIVDSKKVLDRTKENRASYFVLSFTGAGEGIHSAQR